jgi:hypothetical protein
LQVNNNAHLTSRNNVVFTHNLTHQGQVNNNLVASNPTVNVTQVNQFSASQPQPQPSTNQPQGQVPTINISPQVAGPVPAKAPTPIKAQTPPPPTTSTNKIQ